MEKLFGNDNFKIYGQDETYILENAKLLVKVALTGAELKSIFMKERQFEALHQPDSLWGRQSPILFPFAGRLHEQKYLYEREIYDMPMHGFLRDMTFKFDENASQLQAERVSAVFTCRSDEHTLKQFPFKFEVNVVYELSGCTLSNYVHIKNLDSATMYFAIGFHPGFVLPPADFAWPNKSAGTDGQADLGVASANSKTDISDFRLLFPERDALTLMHINQENGLAQGRETSAYPLENRALHLTAQDFELRPWFFKDTGNSVCLYSQRAQATYLKLTYNLPILGIWQQSSPEKTADFICLEPWSSTVGREDVRETLESMPERLALAGQKTFTAAYTVEFLPQTL